MLKVGMLCESHLKIYHNNVNSSFYFNGIPCLESAVMKF